jgi:hypothetical protein
MFSTKRAIDDSNTTNHHKKGQKWFYLDSLVESPTLITIKNLLMEHNDYRSATPLKWLMSVLYF